MTESTRDVTAQANVSTADVKARSAGRSRYIADRFG